MVKVITVCLMMLIYGCISEKDLRTIVRSELDKSKETAMDRCVQKIISDSDCKEWDFVNNGMLYSCACQGSETYAQCGCIHSNEEGNEEHIFQGYFSHYTTMEKLNKKWLGKPIPEKCSSIWKHNRLQTSN